MKPATLSLPPVDVVLRHASRDPLARVVERCMRAAPRGGSVIVAASGGGDSTALAVLAAAVAARGPWSIRLVTVDHGLRAESAADAAFVQELGAWLGVPVDRERVQVERGPGLSARARAARYRVLRERAQATGSSLVLLAHHAQDQLETVLMRLLRGCGAAAAGGMPHRRRLASGCWIMRPLLETSRQHLLARLQAWAVPWREDASNLDASRPRGRLRQRVLPELESLAPRAAERASRAARRVRGAAAALEREAAAVLADPGPWSRARLRKVPAATLAEAIRRRCPDAADASVERATEAMRDRSVRPRRIQLAGVWLLIRTRLVSLEPRVPPA
ncbi:MAG: tRNA(Ile)-lysidine synthase [Planctomycetota bacterium]